MSDHSEDYTDEEYEEEQNSECSDLSEGLSEEEEKPMSKLPKSKAVAVPAKKAASKKVPVKAAIKSTSVPKTESDKPESPKEDDQLIVDEDLLPVKDLASFTNLPEDKNAEPSNQIKINVQQSVMSKLPAKPINGDADLFDVLLTSDSHESQREELVGKLEDLILSKDETSFVYLRIGKLFNHISSILKSSIDKKDFLEDSETLAKLRSFLDLFLRTLQCARYSAFAKQCSLPKYRMQIDITEDLLTKLLTLASTKAHLLPENCDALLTQYILFVLESPDPYCTPIASPFELLANFLKTNLDKQPNKNFFRVLTLSVISAPPAFTHLFLEGVILPLIAKFPTLFKSNEAKEDQIDFEDKLHVGKHDVSDVEEEGIYQTLTVLLAGLNNKAIRKAYIDAEVPVKYYEILRDICPALSKKALKLSTRNTRAIINLINTLLPELNEQQFNNMRDILFADVATCIEEKHIDFVLQYLVPLLASVNYPSTPLCLHFEEDIDSAINRYKSRSPVSSGKGDTTPNALNSEILSTQDRQVLLQKVQEISISPKSDAQLRSLQLDNYEWKRSFKIDHTHRYALNTAKIHQEIQNNQGVLFVFHCLINDEICKLGVFCGEKLAQADSNDAILAHHYRNSESKLSFANHQNFAFLYSNTQKLHFLSNQKAASKSEKSSEGRSQPSNCKDQPVFVEFCDSRIIAYIGGASIIEYFPIRPETNRVTINPNKLLSVEAQLGQKVKEFKGDAVNGFTYVQSMECWTLNCPDDKKGGASNEVAADFKYISTKILEDSTAYLRPSPLMMVPGELSIEQVLALTLKNYTPELAAKVSCRMHPNEPAEVGVHANRLLDLYQGRTQNVLDLFLTSSEQGSSESLQQQFEGRSHSVYQFFSKLVAKNKGSLICKMLVVEKLQEIMTRLAILAKKNNKKFESDFLTISNEINVFLTVDGFHRHLVEDERFFLLLLKIIDVSIKNDYIKYQNGCMFFKLQRIVFRALNRVFQDKAKENFANSKLHDLIAILLKKMSELPSVADLTQATVVEAPTETNDVKLGDLLEGGKSHTVGNDDLDDEDKEKSKIAERNKKLIQQIKTRLCKETFQYVLSSVETLCEWDFDRKLKRDFMNQVKQLQLIRPISAIIGECSSDNKKAKQNPFFQQLNGLLKRWSQDFIYSEIFWETVADSENKNGELNFSLYQMLLSQSEAHQTAIDENGKEDKKKEKEKESEATIQRRLDFIDFFNAINTNLKQLYMIDIVEKSTDLAEYLALPLSHSYSKLLQDMCVDSTSMLNENGEYDHHYKSSVASNPNQSKTQRIVKELNDLTNSLPVHETNAIFLRYDKDRMDVMKSLIMGSAGTPYAHGAFIYDIFVVDNYPNGPPLCNLETTGNHAVRFNPNLYACGKVCLSLLGTWRGSTNENWNPQLSTILQVLISIQSLIMSEEVYFNEPGYEGTKGTPEGELLNEGYSNIVKYANVKYAMVEAIRNPYPWFKEVIQIHFYLKKDMILEEVNTWIKAAETTTGQYSGLVSSHNSSLCSQFSSDQKTYLNMLKVATEELKEEFANLNLSISKTIKSRSIKYNKKDFMGAVENDEDIDSKVEKIDDIDVGYEEKVQQRAIDIKDEQVTNRWSRYIGAMGIEAVEKQANAQICLFGLNALGVEIAKNIILSGVKRFTICDSKKVEYEDIAGQFYLSEADVGKNRALACLNKLQALNQYVVIDYIESSLESTYTALDKFLLGYNVVIACEGSEAAHIALNDYCRTTNSYFISAINMGVCSRVFCDFGENFKVVDKTGEEFPDMHIQSISHDSEGLVKLLENTKHDLQDGDEVLITEIEEDESDPDQRTLKDTHHKVRVNNKSSFFIGDTTYFRKLTRNCVMRQMKGTAEINFKPLSQIEKEDKAVPFDQNLSFSDWNFDMKGLPLHIAYKKLDQYIKKNKAKPKPWSVELAKSILEEVQKELQEKHPDQWKTISASENNTKLFEQIIKAFAHTCRGTFPPLSAFIGGVVAQEAIKSITKKYMPIQQYLYYECSEVVKDLDAEKVHQEVIKVDNDRDYGLKKCIGAALMSKLATSRVFMVGAGAIGCELLKNYAMLSLGSGKEAGKEGRIYLTDPDVIENSNLNRQFLFREKHIRKPKSTTGAAVTVAMNSKLKGHVMPLVEKVHDQTERLFTNKFFENIDIVTNALDNVQARRYVDARCVNARTPLLESGTLGPKGHVQVILPHKTESYGSQSDPQDNNEIPYCTLKMFPEETLHCVEWARDKFNKMFLTKPRSFEKVIENSKTFEDLLAQEHVILREALNYLKALPTGFEDCVAWARNKFEKFFVNDIKQLIHVYPLDKKLENGNLFWTLPKRPPTEVVFDPENESHAAFIGALACLRAVTCNIKLPDNARELQTKLQISQQATGVKVKEFVPSDKKAQELKAQADKSKTDPANADNKPEKANAMDMSKDEIAKSLLAIVKERVGDLETAREQLKVTPQEFEKDADENFHVDVLAAMTNCRASNYKLEKMDWLTVKLKAGRIIPALATTTSAIAALQTIELVKIIANCKLEDYKNTFLNLSLPSLTQSEPSPAPVYTLSSNLKATLWDRWDIRLSDHKNITNIKTLFAHLQETTQLEPLDCLRGNAAIYVHSLMSMANKAKEKDQLLERSLADALSIRPSEENVDITVTFTSEKAKEENPKDATIKGVPPIRLIL